MSRGHLMGLMLSLLVLGSALSAQVTEKPEFDWSRLRPLPVLERTRYKPLDSLARESIERITGKEPFQKKDALLHYFHWMFEPERARTQPYLKLPDAQATRAVGFEPSQDRTHVSYNDLYESPKWAKAWAEAQAKAPESRSTTDTEILKLAQRYVMFANIAVLDQAGKSQPELAYLPMVPPAPPHARDREEEFRNLAEAGKARWSPAQIAPVSRAFAALGTAFRENQVAAFADASGELVASLGALGYPAQPDSRFRGADFMAREVKYNAGRFFYRSFWVYFSAFLIGLLAMGFSSIRSVTLGLRWIGVAVATYGLGLHAYGLFERTMLSERAMIGTFYESMLFVAGTCALTGLVFEFIVKNGWFVLAGALGAALAMYVATHNPDFMQPQISNLAAVLDNNDWIHIHVPTIMTGYAVLAVAILLAHVYLIRSLWLDDSHELQKSLARTMFWTVPVGEIVLVAGIILGGIWADASWGRFWGFDPKEVGALILFLVFMVIIHGRWAGWLKDFGTAVGGWVGSLALFWSYYGTNFFWTGKHSYAAAGGDRAIPTWMIIYLGTELAILALVLARRYLFGSSVQVSA